MSMSELLDEMRQRLNESRADATLLRGDEAWKLAAIVSEAERARKAARLADGARVAVMREQRVTNATVLPNAVGTVLSVAHSVAFVALDGGGDDGDPACCAWLPFTVLAEVGE